MKRKLLLLLVLIAPFFCNAQNLVLPNISIPGGIRIGAMNGAVLGENLIGPRKILFSGNQLILQREETGNKPTGFGVAAPNIDKLPTLYSGRIFSEGIIEPYVFTNKTPEELVLIEVTVFPKILEQPYTLFIDLVVQTSSKPVQASQTNQSDDAGEYKAKILVSIIEI